MPCKLLVAAKDLADDVFKGDIVEVHLGSYEWGDKEALPNFIRITITNRNKAEADEYLRKVTKIFTYSIDGQNAQGVRATISVDQSASGILDLEVKQELKTYILEGADLELAVTEFAQTPASLTIDIVLADDENRMPTLQSMRDNINDKFSDAIRYRRYFFNPASVDTVIASGGSMSVTAAQAAANIVDRAAA